MNLLIKLLNIFWLQILYKNIVYIDISNNKSIQCREMILLKVANIESVNGLRKCKITSLFLYFCIYKFYFENIFVVCWNFMITTTN